MISRRALLATASAAGVIALSPTARHLAAQDTELAVQNATFVDDAMAGTFATPEASPVVNPDLRGYILGESNASHTLQIYSDYRCPHCRDFAHNVEPELIVDFVETGRINLELIDFTVVGVPAFDQLHVDVLESVQAAEAAACAAEQNAFLPYRTWLFDGPVSLEVGDFADSHLLKAALDLGLDIELFLNSLADGKFEAGVISMVELGISRGVQGTPTMILDGGEPFFMTQDGYPGLKKLLDEKIGE